MTKKAICLIIGCLIIGATFAQEYKKVQVSLSDGIVLKGKNASINDASVSFTSGSILKTYPLTDVNLIQAKEGKAGKWALGFGGGCLGICIISGLAVGSEGIEEVGGTTGTYIAGSIIWTGIFAGVGYLIGNAADDWQVVYQKTTSSILNKFDFNIGSDPIAKINFTLTYKF
jgi:hypothetical protein